jgi:uncharacterized membrane protein YdjX (TVP38/TMEM64 family)
MEAKLDAADGKRIPWWRPVILLAVITTIFLLGHRFGLGDRLGVVRDWIQSLGAWGPVIFVLFYAASAVVAIPGSILTVGAGALFGTLLGVILVSIASTLGASLAFLVARYFARDAVTRWLSSNEKFRQIDQLTARRGAMIVGLTRLVPLFPYDLLNYAFGLTNIPFRTYLFWSWLCMLPGTVLYVAGADALFSGISRGEVPWGLIAVMGAAAVVVIILVRYARRKLHQSATSK